MAPQAFPHPSSSTRSCRARPTRAFDYFTRDIGRWWPVARYSCSEARAAGVSFERREGGKHEADLL